MTETDNHQLNRPGRGETEWDVPLNENATTLDTAVEVRDTASNRNDYTPADGAKFVAADTGEVWLGDGDNWNAYSTLTRRLDHDRTASGDGAQTAFTLSHDLGEVPTHVSVQPTSEDAAATHWVSDTTDADVTVTYASAPADATDNLTWSLAVEVNNA